jgi:hypothetical protein
MNANRILAAAAALAAACVAGRATAQATAPASGADSGATATAPDRYQELEDRVRALEAEPAVGQDAQGRSGGGGGPRFVNRPGWEKPDLWMWPGFRAEETKDMLIGSVGEIDLYMGLNTAGRLQYLVQDVTINGVEPGDLEPAFQTAWGNLSFLADVGDGDLLVFADLYLSSRPHPSTTYGNEGYMLFRRIPDDSSVSRAFNESIFEYVNVKLGHFEIDFGDHHYRRSDNAWVQRNLLIGNYLVDPDVEEIGAEIFSKPSWPVKWLVGVTSGTTTENLNEGRGIASVHGKVWWEDDDFRVSASGYYVDHSDNPTTGAGATKGSLYSSRRSGGPYGGVWGGGNSPGDLTIGKDELVTALQSDVTWSPGPWDLYGHVGWVEDADPNGSGPGKPSERWIYGAAEVGYHFNPRTWVAGRYCLAQADDILGHDSDGYIHRVQVGAGYWVTKNFLSKVEYVFQTANDFDSADGIVGGVDIANDPSFHGIIFEFSFAF